VAGLSRLLAYSARSLTALGYLRVMFTVEDIDPQRQQVNRLLKRTPMAARHRIYTTSVASVYPHYVTKAERKGRSRAEVDTIICWLTGYAQAELEAHLEAGTDFETFFAEAPQLHPTRSTIRGVICGVRVEEIAEPVMREIRYLDKLVDELAKGRAMEKILRQ
jgi:hypothetical protein